MKINRTIFEFEVLFATMTQAQLWYMATILRDSKNQLIFAKEIIIENTFEFGQNIEEVMIIDEQVSIIDKNLKTLEETLLLHEKKIFKKGQIKGDEQLVCLN